MAKTKRDVRGWTVAQRVETGRARLKALTGNADFPTAPSWLPPFQTATDELDEAVRNLTVKRTDYHAAAVQVRAATKRWDKEHSFLAARVEVESQGEPGKILGAGFALHRARTVTQILAAPESFHGTLGDRPGCLDLSWDSLPKARTYIVQMTADIEAGHWEQVLICTKSSCTIKNLTGGTKYWFRVAGHNSAGTGAFSNPIQRMAS